MFLQTKMQILDLIYPISFVEAATNFINKLAVMHLIQTPFRLLMNINL